MNNHEIYSVDEFPSVFLTADVVVIKKIAKTADQVLLIQRLKDPFKNKWALPGGFFDVHQDDEIEDAAVRELFEETNLKISRNDLKFVGVFSKRGRDPRELIASKPCRIISNAFVTRVDTELNIQAKDDAMAVRWYRLDSLPELAFDHAKIINMALSSIL